jgi:hypothetical protein
MARHRKPAQRTSRLRAATVTIAALAALSLALGPATADDASDEDSATAAAAAKRVPKTRFGTSVPFQRPGETLGDAVNRSRAKYGRLGVIRLFYPGMPAPWRYIRSEVGRVPINVSFKAAPADILSGRYDSFFRGWFRAAPDNRRTWWTYYHEPEDNIEAGEFTARQYRAAWRHLGDLARQADNHRLRPTLVLMCWSLDPYSGRNWRNYYPKGTIKVLSWDCYNEGWSKGEYWRPRALLGKAYRVSKRAGHPWAVAELGSPLAVGDQGLRRARWLWRIENYAREHHARYISYFDLNYGHGDFELSDRPSRRAWANIVPG